MITLALLIGFVALVIWVFFLRRREDFDAAANIPLQDDPATEKTDSGDRK